MYHQFVLYLKGVYVCKTIVDQIQSISNARASTAPDLSTGCILHDDDAHPPFEAELLMARYDGVSGRI
jgi:hypothetical protein